MARLCHGEGCWGWGWGRSSDEGSGLCVQDKWALQGTWGEAGRVGGPEEPGRTGETTAV